MSWSPEDEQFMRAALAEAKVAGQADEVPVGAVVVRNGEIIGRGLNRPVQDCDPTAHAEIVAIRAAAASEKNYRLKDTTLYVTLEPCTMCVGALVQARVKRIVYGAGEPKTGAIQSAHQLFETGKFNHIPEITDGFCEDECSSLLSDFFENKRQQKKNK